MAAFISETVHFAPERVILQCRVQMLFWHFQVTGKEIFQLLKKKHGVGFENFIEEKICPLAGDIMHEDFGVDSAQLRALCKDVDIIVNGAATTNFFERFVSVSWSHITGTVLE